MKPEKAIVQSTKGENKIVNLNLYRIKKSLLDEGFEVVENPDGKITLVIRVSR